MLAGRYFGRTDGWTDRRTDGRANRQTGRRKDENFFEPNVPADLSDKVHTCNKFFKVLLILTLTLLSSIYWPIQGVTFTANLIVAMRADIVMCISASNALAVCNSRASC